MHLKDVSTGEQAMYMGETEFSSSKVCALWHCCGIAIFKSTAEGGENFKRRGKIKLVSMKIGSYLSMKILYWNQLNQVQKRSPLRRDRRIQLRKTDVLEMG